jgi:hypothetical protein
MDSTARAALSTALNVTIPESIMAAELQISVGNRIIDKQNTLINTYWQIIGGLIKTVMTLRESYDEFSPEWEALDLAARLMGLPDNVRDCTEDNCPPHWKGVDEYLTSPLQTDQDE